MCRVQGQYALWSVPIRRYWVSTTDGREPEMCNGIFRPIPPSESVVSTPPAIVQKQETKNRAGGRAGAMICVECEVQTQYMEHTFDPITTLH